MFLVTRLHALCDIPPGPDIVSYRPETDLLQFLLLSIQSFQRQKLKTQHADSPIYKSGQEIIPVRRTAKRRVSIDQALQSNGKSDIGSAHNVLYFEIHVFCRIKSYSFDNVGKLFGRQCGIVRRFDSRDAHFPRGKNEGRGLWFSQSHNDGTKSTGIEFRISTLECNLFQIQTSPKFANKRRRENE